MPMAPQRFQPHSVGKKRARPKPYNDARWRQFREKAIALHLETRGPWCACCDHRLLFNRPGHRANAEVDHITPHHGDPQLMWSLKNLQVLRKSCHSRKTRRENQ